MQRIAPANREGVCRPPAPCCCTHGNAAPCFVDAPRLVLLASFCLDDFLPTPAGVVATGSECAAFRQWIDKLPEEGNHELLQVRQSGFTYDLAALRKQLRRALQACPAGPVCAAVGGRLLELTARLPGAACVVLEEAAGL